MVEEKLTSQMEECIESIYRGKELGKEKTLEQIAQELKTSLGEIKKILDSLKKKGYLQNGGPERIILTRKGKELGASILRKHRFWERLFRFLGLERDGMHEEACQLEHSLSDDLEKKLEKRMIALEGELKGGQSLPEIVTIVNERLISLVSLRPYQRAIISAIYGGRGVQRRLQDLGLVPGAEVTLLREALYGPVEISVRGTSLAIGRGIAQKIFVKVIS